MAALSKTIKQTKYDPPEGYFNTWWKVISDPLNFYEHIPSTRGYKQPTIFALKTQAIVLALLYIFIAFFGFFFWAIVTTAASAGDGLPGLLGGVGMGIVLVIALLLLPLLILLAWGFLYAGTAITHLFVLLFGGKQGFKETFIVNCYATAPNIAVLIPLIGYAASVYTLILQGIGIHKRHKLSVARSIGVVLLPVIILMVIIITGYILLIATLSRLS